jgi:hypothetical protein
MGYDANADVFVLGPGDLEATPGAYPEEQVVFHVFNDGVWTKLGVTAAKSPVGELWAKRFGDFVQVGPERRSVWRAMGNFYLTLLEFDPAQGWRDLVDQTAFKELWDGGHSDNGSTAQMGIVADEQGVMRAFANEGDVYVFNEATQEWSRESDKNELLKRRLWARLCWDFAEQRVVLWGGEIKGRKNNHVLIYEDGAWRQCKKSSPKPKGFARKKRERSVEYQLLYDHGLGAVVRFGYEEVAVLQGEILVPSEPEGYGPLNDDAYRAVMSDPATGQTLVFNWQTGVVFRFDLGGCEQLATIDLPDDLILPKHIDKGYSMRTLCDDVAFDPATRTLWCQNPEDAWGTYRVDLGPVFDAAAKKGDRTQPPPAPTKAKKKPAKKKAAKK